MKCVICSPQINSRNHGLSEIQAERPGSLMLRSEQTSYVKLCSASAQENKSLLQRPATGEPA